MPEFRKINLYVSNKKSDLYRYLNELMKPKLHAGVSDCSAIFTCKSGLVWKNQGDMVVVVVIWLV